MTSLRPRSDVLDEPLAHRRPIVVHLGMAKTAPPKEDLVAFLEALLAQKGLSQRALAREIQADATEVNKWMRGARPPSMEAIMAIAAICETSQERIEALAGRILRLVVEAKGRRKALAPAAALGG